MKLNHNAILAGVFAACASMFSKLALEDSAKTLAWSLDGQLQVDALQQVILGMQGVCILLTILSNAVMWVLFTKSLHGNCTTAEAMVTNSATNFIFSGLFGRILFGEILSLKWFIGFSLMVCGLALLHTENGGSKVEKKHH